MCRFIAWIGHFGGKRGTLICLPEQWADLGFAATAQEAGYYCSACIRAVTRAMTGNILSTPCETGDGLATVKAHRPGTRKSRTTVKQEPPPKAMRGALQGGRKVYEC